jgi:hypothetical protein
MSAKVALRQAAISPSRDLGKIRIRQGSNSTRLEFIKIRIRQDSIAPRCDFAKPRWRYFWACLTGYRRAGRLAGLIFPWYEPNIALPATPVCNA